MIEPYSGMCDIIFSYDTDIMFDSDDLATTSGVDFIEREIFKLMITSPGEWKIDPTIGCGLQEFNGQENTRTIAQRIENRIQNGLRLTVFPAQVTARAVPTDYDTIVCFVDVVGSNINITSIPFEFVFTGGTIKMLRNDKNKQIQSSQTISVNDINNLRKPNKYQDRIRSNNAN